MNDLVLTDRYAAERLSEAHFEELLRIHADPVQMEYLGGVRDERQTREYLERNLAHWAEHGFGLWMVRDRLTGEIVGRAVVRRLRLDGVDEVEIGYGLRPDCWGRGLGTRIATACIRYAFDVLRLPTVVALTDPRNARSRRVLEKVGMTFQREARHEGAVLAVYRADYAVIP